MCVWMKLTNLFKPQNPSATEPLRFGSRQIPLLMIRHPRARRYLLRLRSDGVARVTIPRGGTQTEARAFVERNRDWLEQQLARQQVKSAGWQIGTEIWFRGERVRIEAMEPDQIRFGGEILKLPKTATDLQPVIEKHLRILAMRELPARVMEFAALHQSPVKRVTVRNQKSRWGSCSHRGTISLNWRLIQTPDWVRDYIILHELAHLRQMNHSDKFWLEVQKLCPDYLLAERWLKQNAKLLR